MSFRIVDRNGNLLGMLRLQGSVRVVDLESLRRLGAHKVELVNAWRR